MGIPKQIEQAARSPYSHRRKLIYNLPLIYLAIYVAKVVRKRANWRVKMHRHLTWLLTVLDLCCFLGRCFFKFFSASLNDYTISPLFKNLFV